MDLAAHNSITQQNNENIWYVASVPVTLPNEKHTRTYETSEAQSLWAPLQPSAWMNKRGLSIWFHSFILSLTQPPIPFWPPLNLFCDPISLSLSLSLSLKHLFHLPKSILFSLTCFQLVLLSISYCLSLIPPSLILSFQFLLFNFPIWFSLFAGKRPLSLSLSLIISVLLICQSISLPFHTVFHSSAPVRPSLDLQCTHHCSVIQPSISSSFSVQTSERSTPKSGWALTGTLWDVLLYSGEVRGGMLRWKEGLQCRNNQACQPVGGA